MQVIIDNGPPYKATGEILKQQLQIYRTPYAGHRIDLMLIDIGRLCRVQQAVESTQTISRFIYNHAWILSMMQRYTWREILRSSVIWFVMNYIALDNLLDKKEGRPRQMFVSADWQESRYARARTQRSTTKNLMTRKTFQQWIEKVVKVICYRTEYQPFKPC